MNIRERLERLVNEAEALLSGNRELYTDGWCAELRRMTELAKDTLNGADVPFVRSCGFCEPCGDDAVMHAEEYHSFTPSYSPEIYGLEQALSCFKASRADLRTGELREAAARYKKELLETPTDGKAGSVDLLLKGRALSAINLALESEPETAPSELVLACNAVRRCRMTRVYQRDIEPESNLFFGKADREELLERIGTQPEIKRAVDRMEKSAALTMQTDAFMYYLTGNKVYARKAKDEFIYVLYDFCRRTGSRFAHNERPDGCDACGEVQSGRIMCSLMSAYTFIKNAVAFTESEKKTIAAQLKYLASYLFDGRPRTELTMEDVRKNAWNWQTDMACGMGLFIMETSQSGAERAVLDDVNYFLRSRLDSEAGSGGLRTDWNFCDFSPPGIIAVYAKALKNVTGEDLFKEATADEIPVEYCTAALRS